MFHQKPDVAEENPQEENPGRRKSQKKKTIEGIPGRRPA